MSTPRTWTGWARSKGESLLLCNQHYRRSPARDLRRVRQGFLSTRRRRAGLQRLERGKMNLSDPIERGLTLRRTLHLRRDELRLAGEFLHRHRDVLGLIDT